MTSRSTTFLVAFGLIALVATEVSVVWATHDEPGRGRAVRGSLVTAYDPCTAPNTNTLGGFSVPACAPAVRSDPICGFGALDGMLGSGKAKGVVGDGDVGLSAVLSGLGLGCEGTRLCGVIRVRVTTDRCAAGSCTTVDLVLTNESSTACCVVANGRCRVKTTVNTEIFDAIRPGQRAGIEVLGCGLRRVDGPTPPAIDQVSFVCGTLAP